VRPIPVCRPIVVGREVHSFSLYWLDHERGHVIARELLRQRVDVTEGHLLAARKQRSEAVAELRASVQRKSARGEPVKGVVTIEDSIAFRRAAGELQGALDGFGTGVGEDHPLDARMG
jgi:hypothetical protein